MNNVLSVTEASQLLRVSVPSLNRWRIDGSGPQFLKLGGCVRYREADLAAWLDSKLVRSTSQVSAGGASR